MFQKRKNRIDTRFKTDYIVSVKKSAFTKLPDQQPKRNSVGDRKDGEIFGESYT